MYTSTVSTALCFGAGHTLTIKPRTLRGINIMRRELAKQEGQRKRFRATFIRLGKKNNYQGYSEETILLNRVIDTETGNVVTDHLWFTYTKGFQDARIREGDTIEFDARVKEYQKGYVNLAYGINHRKQDYKLSHPTRIAVVNSQANQ